MVCIKHVFIQSVTNYVCVHYILIVTNHTQRRKTLSKINKLHVLNMKTPIKTQMNIELTPIKRKNSKENTKIKRKD